MPSSVGRERDLWIRLIFNLQSHLISAALLKAHNPSGTTSSLLRHVITFRLSTEKLLEYLEELEFVLQQKKVGFKGESRGYDLVSTPEYIKTHGNLRYLCYRNTHKDVA